MDAIPVIAISGGPCAGKTTGLSFLQQKLADLGFAVVTVPEIPTEFMLSDITPQALGGFAFQRQVLKYMLEKEARWKEAVRSISGKKPIVLCDRGIMDIAAYTPAHEFDLLLNELGHTVVDMRDKRYDAVMFLRSVAVDRPEIYTCLNNPARRERTVEEARAVDERTLAAWTGHPHLRIIDNSADDGLEGKIKRVFQDVCRVIGIPTPLEIERKYLVHHCDMNSLPRPMQQVNIVQYYLANSNPDTVERIRMRGQDGGHTYYHTIKQMLRPGVRTETERQITREEYAEYLHQVDGRFGKIEKIRYCFIWKNQYFELDSFRNPQGLTLLELELTNENDAIALPDFLEGHLTDVTDDPHYTNYAIAERVMLNR